MSRWKHKLILLENVNVIDRKVCSNVEFKKKVWRKSVLFSGKTSNDINDSFDVDFIVWVDLHILS